MVIPEVIFQVRAFKLWPSCFKFGQVYLGGILINLDFVWNYHNKYAHNGLINIFSLFGDHSAIFFFQVKSSNSLHLTCSATSVFYFSLLVLNSYHSSSMQLLKHHYSIYREGDINEISSKDLLISSCNLPRCILIYSLDHWSKVLHFKFYTKKTGFRLNI